MWEYFGGNIWFMILCQSLQLHFNVGSINKKIKYLIFLLIISSELWKIHQKIFYTVLFEVTL